MPVLTDKERMELYNLRKRVQGQREELRRLSVDLKDCRNELCLKCGDYKMAHKGACDGCRWKEAG